MHRRLSQDFPFRRLRKRSISDTNLNILEPTFVQNVSTNIQDILDCKSKNEYEIRGRSASNLEERREADGNEENLDFSEECSDGIFPMRKRKTGFIAIGSQVYSSLTKLVRRRFSHPNDPRQLINAIRNQNIERVCYILGSHEVDVNDTNSEGVTATHEAALGGLTDMIKLLLQFRADVNKKDKKGFTCLDYAVFGGHFECAKYLIENGASIKSIQDGMQIQFGMD